MRARLDRWLENSANIAIVVILLFLIASPSGIVGSWVLERVREGNERELIARTWEYLIDSPSVLQHIALGDGTPIVVEFLDYQCAACRAAAAAVSAAADRGTVKVVVRHLPLEALHSAARGAARAAVCAEAQGRFREAHEALLNDDGWIERGDWLGLGEAVDVRDAASFAECLEDVASDERVDLDMHLAAALGIAATPTFVTTEGIYHGERGFLDALREVK